tara:strand:- start:1658 stop:3412 length:1755 start_codon:yes stop_codon:yes gene_type:complete
MKTLKQIFFFLTSKERKKAKILMMMILIMAILDMIGIASILPFMAVVTNVDIVHSNLILNKMYQFSKLYGLQNVDDFLIVLGACVFILFTFSLTFKAYTTYIQIRFVQMCQHNLSNYLVKNYLLQPYSWFLNRNSAEIGTIVLSEVGQVIGKGLSSLLNLIANSMIVILIISMLLFVNFKLSLIISLTIGIFYFIIFRALKSYLYKIGNESLHNNKLRFLTVNEAFNAVKEIKIGGLEKIFSQKFSAPSLMYAINHSLSLIISQMPRFLLEGVSFGSIMLLIIILIKQTGSFNTIIPIISLYVFAGYRLIPAFQNIYNSFTQISFIKPLIDKLYDDIKNLKFINITKDSGKDSDHVSYKKLIKLKDVDYNYLNTSRTILKNINIKIPIKSTIGIIGPTGSGKTTLVDIILGLLEPTGGVLEVDGKNITKNNLKSWQRNLGYVPQQIHLSDSSILQNIAFGVNVDQINFEAVIKAAKIANIHDFIVSDLPDKYQTTIGERGIRLSGGQRQRIGIARALYHNPEVLILDEATSALDNETEQVVMDAIKNIKKDKTIILIAHRLKTIEYCDIVFRMQEGKIVGTDTN